MAGTLDPTKDPRGQAQDEGSLPAARACVQQLAVCWMSDFCLGSLLTSRHCSLWLSLDAKCLKAGERAAAPAAPAAARLLQLQLLRCPHPAAAHAAPRPAGVLSWRALYSASFLYKKDDI